MQRKKILVILMTAILFASALFLGVTAVFRVREVSVDVSAVSDDAVGEALVIENKIKETYLKKSIFRLDESAVSEILSDFPYFRLTGFKTVYPDLLMVSLSEDAEAFAFYDGEGNYDILSAEGTFLSRRDSCANRSDGKDNVIVSGAYSNPERAEALNFLVPLANSFGGIRVNVVSVDVDSPLSDKSILILTLKMREGVSVVLLNAVGAAGDVAQSFCDFYAQMTTEQRTSGTVYIPQNGNPYYEP